VGRLIACIAVVLCLCSAAGPRATVAAPAKLTSVTVAMGFTPNVQFAPFYVAETRGYYRQAGLRVEFQYGIEPNLLRLASVGKVDFVNSGGDEVLTAGAQGLHVTYVLTQYSRFPAALFWLQRSGIHRVNDLRGRTVGIPGPFGASYVGLLALLQSAGVPATSVSIKSISFTQAQSVAHGKVDAAVGYAMNEPVELRQQGYRVGEFDVYRYANLAGAGIAAGNAVIAKHPAIVQAFVRATLRGMQDTLRNPEQAFADAAAAAPEIRAQRQVSHAILQRALDFWRPVNGHQLGWIDPQVWNTTARLLYQFKQIPHRVASTRFYTNRFISDH